MAAEILTSLLDSLRRDFAAGRWGAFEAAKGFWDGPCAAWAARARAAISEAGEEELDSRLRGSFLDLDRACRAVTRLVEAERRCRRDEVCAGVKLAPLEESEANLKDLRSVLESLASDLGEPGLRQLLELADSPEPDAGAQSRPAHPAARLAPLLLLDAGRRGASDVLAVPGPHAGLVQYRLGGVLVPILELSLSFHRALVARFKAMAASGINAAKRPAAQDEEIPAAIVRTLPTAHGERLDIHLEGPPRSIRDPQELGFSPKDGPRYASLLSARCGLIIHAGLSGSGKSTALLAAAAALARQGRDVFCIVSGKYQDIPGASVCLTGPARTPVALLRSARERRPDAIIVDDLGSPETMREALQAAAGSALVLGGLSCDCAWAAWRRLWDMNPPVDLLRQSLLGILAQRLPRRLCACANQGQPAGCPACLNTGFRGVAPAFELLTVGNRLKPLLKPETSDADWLKAAREDGLTPFSDSLQALVQEGATSLAEARRLGLGA